MERGLEQPQGMGIVGCLNARTSLQKLDLESTQVTGDISNLRALTSLRMLPPCRTQVTGDIGSLSAPTILQTLDLLNTTVKGDIVSLNALTSLQTFYLLNTKVKGDIGSWSTARSVVCITGSVSVQLLARRETPFAIKKSSAELKARCTATSLCSSTESPSGSRCPPPPKRWSGRAEADPRQSTLPSLELGSRTALCEVARTRDLGEPAGLRCWLAAVGNLCTGSMAHVPMPFPRR